MISAGVASRQRLELALRQLDSVADDASFAAAERELDDPQSRSVDNENRQFGDRPVMTILKAPRSISNFPSISA